MELFGININRHPIQVIDCYNFIDTIYCNNKIKSHVRLSFNIEPKVKMRFFCVHFNNVCTIPRDTGYNLRAGVVLVKK